jgi:hypothetical protein
VDRQLGPVVQQQHDNLQQAAGGVEAEPQLAGGPVVRDGVGDQVVGARVLDVVVADAVLARLVVDLHPGNRNTEREVWLVEHANRAGKRDVDRSIAAPPESDAMTERGLPLQG